MRLMTYQCILHQPVYESWAIGPYAHMFDFEERIYVEIWECYWESRR